MKKSIFILTLISGLMGVLGGCSYPRNFTSDFYAKNEQRLETIKDDFNRLYNQHPFSILFEEKTFTNISFEFNEDSIKYIYHFNIHAPAFTDSLKAHHYQAQEVQKLVENMRAIQCTWIANVDYYEGLKARRLTQMSVRNKALNSTLKGESYCTLVFFETPQPFNNKGIFLDRSDRKRRRQINGNVLKRVNDKVGYTITKKYR
ncbi:hypothetical protein [Niabella drilacis]|uniref:Lipoprotein n=1 Tax=Niabella drilacis (strain DSM 25811 / CCM 8410 / CCUG 62505 / LMG 26954 / E90) TaxID=1285928 RepID=A0A1G6IMS8_NIADE|nr:hypothetical protein [Niabella drilacis]SDC07753.1 hypothetical protein SAMN04487894_101275 [Niabella drilacis]